MATKTNPYEDASGKVLPGKTLEWMDWRTENGDTSLDSLSEGERQRELTYRQRLQDRMQSEQNPS